MTVMLHYVIVKTVVLVGHTGTRQAALDKQDLSYTFLAHHELNSIKLLSSLLLSLSHHH